MQEGLAAGVRSLKKNEHKFFLKGWWWRGRGGEEKTSLKVQPISQKCVFFAQKMRQKFFSSFFSSSSFAFFSDPFSDPFLSSPDHKTCSIEPKGTLFM